MKKIIASLLVLVMLLSMAACGTAGAPETTPSTEPSSQSTPAEVSFTVVVVDADGTETTFHYTSAAKTLGEALVAEGLIDGEQGDYGLFITSVNGITADWDTEKAYWAILVDGEGALTGADQIDLVAGTTYTFVKTVS